MVKQYSYLEKQQLVAQYHSGKSVAHLCLETEIPRSTIYSWIKPFKITKTISGNSVTPKEFDSLKRKTEKLESIINVLKMVNCTSSSSLREKLAELEPLFGQFSVYVLCEALDVPRGTFYNHLFHNKRNTSTYCKRREEFRVLIQHVFEESNHLFGAAKIRATLSNRGYSISEKLVTELMKEMGLSSIRSTSKKDYLKFQPGKNMNILKRKFDAANTNQIWVSDVTCFKLNDKHYYICVILDLFSRMIIAYRISQRNSTQLITSTFKQAYTQRQPKQDLIFHSDRGTPYTSYAFRKLLGEFHIKQSLSQSGRPCDNAVAESFFSTLKQEELYRAGYRSELDFKKGVEKYIVFYNTQRPHTTLNYKTPDQFEKCFIYRQL